MLNDDAGYDGALLPNSNDIKHPKEVKDYLYISLSYMLRFLIRVEVALTVTQTV